MHAISSYHRNSPTHTTQTHTNPQTGAITIHCIAKLSAPQCKNSTIPNEII